MSKNKNLIGRKVHSEDFGGWQGEGIEPGPIYGTIINADENDIQVEWVCASGEVWKESIPRDGYLE